jgi:hypothetical protein
MADNKLIERIASLLQDQTEEPTKADVSKAVKIYFADKKSAAKSSAKKTSNQDGDVKKRQPSAYNVFMREQMAILKENEADKEKDDCMSAKAKMQHIAALWKTKKNGEEFVEAQEVASVSSDDETEEEESLPQAKATTPTPVAVESKSPPVKGRAPPKKK